MISNLITKSPLFSGSEREGTPLCKILFSYFGWITSFTARVRVSRSAVGI